MNLNKISKEEQEHRREEGLKVLSKGMGILTLKSLKDMAKIDLVTIILLRESSINNIQAEFKNSLNEKDREVFKHQQKQIDDLTILLMRDDNFYKEYKESLKENEFIIKKNTFLRRENALLKKEKLCYKNKCFDLRIKLKGVSK